MQMYAREENNSPNGGDINNDGIQDVDQENVTTFVNPIVDNKYVAIELKGTECTKNTKVSYYRESDLPTQDDQYDYPLGLHGDDIECGVKGGTATVVYYWDKKYDTGKWLYRKYLKNEKKYVDFSDQVTYGEAEVDGKKVTTVMFKITDGGPYDSDGVANGIIVDPAGPVILKDEDGSIGNTVWLDSNGNGIQDRGEPGLKGIHLKLKDDRGEVIARTKTNHNGHYIFKGLKKGTYKVVVREKDVNRYVQTYDPDNKMDGKDTVHLKKGQHYTKGDFGYNNQEFRLAVTGESLWESLCGVLRLIIN